MSMSSVTSISPQAPSVVSMDSASAQLFEECVTKLTAIVDRSGQPLEELKGHPSVRPVMKKMRMLLNSMEGYASEAEENKDGALATVTDISSRFGSR